MKRAIALMLMLTVILACLPPCRWPPSKWRTACGVE